VTSVRDNKGTQPVANWVRSGPGPGLRPELEGLASGDIKGSRCICLFGQRSRCRNVLTSQQGQLCKGRECSTVLGCVLIVLLIGCVLCCGADAADAEGAEDVDAQQLAAAIRFGCGCFI
jgi:hypothetical protein